MFVAVVVSAEHVLIGGVRGASWSGPLIFAGLFTASSFLPTTAGTVASAEAASVREFSRRAIRWREVESVTREGRVGGARFVLLHETGERKTRPLGLLSGSLAWELDFHARYETILHWWATGRDAWAGGEAASAHEPGRRSPVVVTGRRMNGSAVARR